MRISYILDTFGGGGKERRCLQVIQGLNRQGYNDIQVVIINNNIAYKELYETTAKIEIIDRKNKGLNQIQTAKALYALLKEFRPDIVQAWSLMSAGSIVTKSVAPHTVVGGNPARYICTTEEFYERNKQYNVNTKGLGRIKKKKKLLSLPDDMFIKK